MTDRATDRCSLCKFFVPGQPSTCHANPPTPLLVPGPPDANGQATLHIMGAFPGVEPGGWCGKFSLDLAAR